MPLQKLPLPKITRFESCDSTNRLLLDAAEAGAPAGSVYVTRQQLAGRGRRIEAAQLLGIGRNTITRKIQELRLDEDAPAKVATAKDHPI